MATNETNDQEKIEIKVNVRKLDDYIDDVINRNPWFMEELNKIIEESLKNDRLRR